MHCARRHSASQAARRAERQQLQLVRLDGLSGAARAVARPDRAAMLMQEIGAALRASSIGGDAAGRLGEDAFGVVTRRRPRAVQRDAALVADLAEAMRGAGIPDGQVAEPRVARLDISLGKLNDSEAGQVFAYAMNSIRQIRGWRFRHRRPAGRPDHGDARTPSTASRRRAGC